MKRIAAWALILIVIGLGFWFIFNRPGEVDSNRYQAIFLTNGQVYFGKIVRESARPLVARDVYYLRVKQPLQQSADESSDAGADDARIQLVKLGNELHGPEAEMRINPDQILFIEDLRTDSQVVKTIESAQANKEE